MLERQAAGGALGGQRVWGLARFASFEIALVVSVEGDDYMVSQGHALPSRN
jgi:hypothetical protein